MDPLTDPYAGAPYNENLANDRTRFAAELQDNPALLDQFNSLVHNEVGSQGPEAQQAFAETVFNRASARGKSLADTINDRNYYPAVSFRPRNADYYLNIAAAMHGADVSRGATGNASGTVGFAGGPMTFAAGGERFGVEGPDLNKTQRDPLSDPYAGAPLTSKTGTGRVLMAGETAAPPVPAQDDSVSLPQTRDIASPTLAEETAPKKTLIDRITDVLKTPSPEGLQPTEERARAFVHGAGVPSSLAEIKDFLLRSPIQDVKDIYTGLKEIPQHFASEEAAQQTIENAPLTGIIRDPLSPESFGTYGTIAGMLGPGLAHEIRGELAKGIKPREVEKPTLTPAEQDALVRQDTAATAPSVEGTAQAARFQGVQEPAALEADAQAVIDRQAEADKQAQAAAEAEAQVPDEESANLEIGQNGANAPDTRNVLTLDEIRLRRERSDLQLQNEIAKRVTGQAPLDDAIAEIDQKIEDIVNAKTGQAEPRTIPEEGAPEPEPTAANLEIGQQAEPAPKSVLNLSRKAGDENASTIASPKGLPSGTLRGAVDEKASLRQPRETTGVREQGPEGAVQQTVAQAPEGTVKEDLAGNLYGRGAADTPVEQQGQQPPQLGTNKPGVEGKAAETVPPGGPPDQPGAVSAVPEAETPKIAPHHEALKGLYGEEAIKRGHVLEPEVIAQNGRQDVASGRIDPYQVASKVTSGEAITPRELGAVSAEHENLARQAIAAEKAYREAPTPENRKAFDEARNKAEDFAVNVVKPAGTMWGELGRALQETAAIDYATETGLRQAAITRLNRELTPKESAKIAKEARRVEKVAKASDTATAKLSDAIEKKTKGTETPSEEEMRATLQKVLKDLTPCS